MAATKNNKFLQTRPRLFKGIFCGIVLVVSLVLSPHEFKFQKSLNGTLDKKLGTAAVFFGIAETASLTVSLLPEDVGSEISEQLANVAGFFLLVMGAITLELCGQPVAVNPDRFLARTAKQRGWDMLRFK